MAHRGNDARRDLEGRNLPTPTDGQRNAYRTPTKQLQDADNAPMKDYRVRLPVSWWEALRERAAAEGLKPSQLIRRLVADYLKS